MNFSISLSTAKHLFVDACGVANGSKCNISALDYIHFSLIGGIAEVLGTDTQSIVRQSSPIDAFEDYEICIKAKKLNTFISSFTDESKPLKFQFDENKVIVKHGRSRASIATMSCDSYPIPKIVIPIGFQFSCDAESFKSAISGIFWYISYNAKTNFSIIYPALLFCLEKDKQEEPNGLIVFALPSNQRPNENTHLYHAPLMNIYSNGVVCQGNATLPKKITSITE